LIEKILQFAKENEMLPEYGLVLVCVSGGADSMCLLEAMRHISYEQNLTIAVAHYNHELRGEESDRDETFVLEICETHGIPFYSGRGDVSAYAKRQGLSIEEAARDMRYDFFYETAEKTGAQRIATAHTADDNAETMLINLIRGAGGNGMSGIPPVRDNVIRPLLRISRDEVMNFIDDRDILYVEDSTNSLDIYTRNKIRHSIIPVIREINPRFNEAAATAAELFRADEEFITDIADLFILECCIGLTADAADLAVLPFSVGSRVVRKLYALGAAGEAKLLSDTASQEEIMETGSSYRGSGAPSLSHKHVKAVLELCENDSPSASLSLPGMTVSREYERIVFNAGLKVEDEEFAPVYPADGDSLIILGLGLKITCKSGVYDDNIHGAPLTGAEDPVTERNVIKKQKIDKSFTSFLFKSAEICGKITVRPRREGDSIRLNGQSGTKTLKKLFIEKRIPVRKRALIPVISDDEGVLGIYRLGLGDRAAPEHGDQVLHIKIEEIPR